MRHVLHIITRLEDPLALAVIDQQQAQKELMVQVVDLTKGEPDYRALLADIFESDSIEIW